MKPGEALLRVRDLSVVYVRGARELQALRGVSLELRAGRLLALVGESGSGKSTLGLALLGLLPSNGRVTAGSLEFDGRELARADEATWRDVRGAGIAMQFQDALAALDPLATIGAQVAEGPRFADGLSASAAAARAREVLASVGLPEPQRLASRYPHELSGGMRQRALLACALARGPRVLVADEPTSALDPTLGLRILELIRARAAGDGMAVLWITHDLSSAAFASDEMVVLYAGSVVERASTATLVARPRHPYSVALLAAARAREERHPLPIAVAGPPPRTGERPSGCAFRDRCPLARAACGEREPVLAPISDAHWVACPYHQELAP